MWLILNFQCTYRGTGRAFLVNRPSPYQRYFCQQIDADGHTTSMRAGYFDRHAEPAHNNRLYSRLSQIISAFIEKHDEAVLESILCCIKLHRLKNHSL